ncbi:MAG: T9SS type A sorting domain-containing protein [Bacteroidia bacterium]|nr:T9SS type A sorting domain-containing protein [Bacteroidia bacterium]
MKTSTYIIRIPEPCHEDWNKMQPDDKGKFCGSCSKSVFDFSNKTDNEIKDILMAHKGEHVCGHFKKSQVNRPLNISINLADLPKNVSIAKAFAIALFLSFGTMLFSCTTLDGKKIDTIEMVNTITNETVPPDTLMELGKVAVSGKIKCTEETVDGGLKFEEVIIEQPPVINNPPDSLFFKEPIMGIMVIDPEPLDTAVTEPVPAIPKNTIEEVINKKASEFSVYPNPTTGEFVIKYEVLKRADVRIDISDLKGALLKRVVNVPGQFEGKYNIPVNLNYLPNGIYIIDLNNDGKRSTQKIVIEK